VALDVVPAHERAPTSRIVSVSATDRLRALVTVENLGPDDEHDARVRLVLPGGRVLGETRVPALASGERTALEVSGVPDAGEVRRALRVALELVRQPNGFHETVEDRWPLVLDPASSSTPRGGSRR
jgi:CARDB